MSTIKVDNIDSKDSAGNITVSRPLVATLTAGSINNLNNLLTPANASVTAAKMATTDTLPAWNGSALTNVVPADNSVTGAKLNISLLAGDTMYASGTDTLARLAKGTAGQALVMNSGATAPEWGEAGGGKIVSVTSVNKTDAWSATVTNTWVDVTDMTVTTPTLATGSKVLVICNFYSNSVNYHGSFRIVDGSGNLITGFVGDAVGSATRSTFGNSYTDMGTLSGGTNHCCLIDNVTSTPARTYKLQAWRGSSGLMHINRLERTSTIEMDFRMPANLTAMEIGA